MSSRSRLQTLTQTAPSQLSEPVWTCALSGLAGVKNRSIVHLQTNIMADSLLLGDRAKASARRKKPTNNFPTVSGGTPSNHPKISTI